MSGKFSLDDLASHPLVAIIVGRRHNCRILAWAKVDAADVAVLSKHEWRFHQGYAICRGRECDHAKPIFMHRLLLGLGPDDGQYYTDHINRDKLDNRRANLRIVTRAENNQNLDPRRGKTSRYRGVSWSRRDKKWEARGAGKPLGLFTDEMEAAAVASAYRAAHMPFAEEAQAV